MSFFVCSPKNISSIPKSFSLSLTPLFVPPEIIKILKPLSKAYFSKENIQIIQNGIRAGVYKISKNLSLLTYWNLLTY